MKFFVSAATKGLGSYRRAVADKLRAIGHEASHQAEFPADNVTVRDMLHARMRNCDAVICLIGPAFGCDCPSTNAGARQSYTQIEYELATRVFDTPTLCLFAAATAELDPFTQSEEDARDQSEFVRQLRVHATGTSGRLFYDFASVAEALGALYEFVRSLEQRSEVPLDSALRHYPLPVVRMWDSLQASTALADDVIDTAEWLVSFLCALAVHDSAASAGEALTPLDESEEESDFSRSLLLFAKTAPRGKFIPELVEWHRNNTELLTSLDTLLRRLSGRRRSREERETLPAQAKHILETLVASLAWLKNYALVSAAATSDGRGHLKVLRGSTAVSLNLANDPGAHLPSDERLYLLNLGSRTALPLWPSLWSLAEEDIFHPVGVARLALAEGGLCLRVRTLGPPGPAGPVERLIRLGDEIEWKALPDAWLRSPSVQPRAPRSARGEARSSPLQLLSDAAWQTLDETLRPEVDREILLAGRFTVTTKLRSGTRTETFLAVAQADSSSVEQHADYCVAYLLPPALADDAVARADLHDRHRRWSALEHSSVLKPLPDSNTEPHLSRPFLLTPFLARHHALDRWLTRPAAEGGRPLTLCEIKSLLRTAAEICADAHGHALRVLSLSARHFLCDPTDVALAMVTGFDTLCEADSDSAAAWAFVQRCSRDRAVAPEIKRQQGQLPPSVDVFAIGQLLLDIHPAAGVQAGHTSLPPPGWTNAWACFAFHCTAIDPSMRFQSVTHCLRALDEWLDRPSDSPPSTVAVPAGRTRLDGRSIEVPAFQIGTHPVTNAQYDRFCRGRHRLPYRENPVREAGPWSPVTGVSLDDAAAYCNWLGRQAGGQWRLPTEAEWMRAAALGDERIYAWGNDAPDQWRANFERVFDGPSVVGACAKGVSAAGCNDMSGNVWEWCSTFLSADRPLRVLKGGAYDFSAEDLRVSVRRGVIRTHRSSHVGFRVVRAEP